MMCMSCKFERICTCQPLNFPRKVFLQKLGNLLILNLAMGKNCTSGIMWVLATINHPFLMVHTTHKNGDDWGMVHDIAIPCYSNMTEVR